MDQAAIQDQMEKEEEEIKKLCLVQVPIFTVQIGIFPVQNRDVAKLKYLQNSGAFWELFWVLLTKTEKFCASF